jgi:hypothetical protein
MAFGIVAPAEFPTARIVVFFVMIFSPMGLAQTQPEGSAVITHVITMESHAQPPQSSGGGSAGLRHGIADHKR